MDLVLRGLQDLLGKKVIERIKAAETDAESMDEFWQTIYSLRTTPVWQILDLESEDSNIPDTTLTLFGFFTKHPVTANSNQPLSYIAIYLMYFPITTELYNSYIRPSNRIRQLLATAPNLNSLAATLDQKNDKKLRRGFRNYSNTGLSNKLLTTRSIEYENPHNPGNKEIIRFSKFHFSNGLFANFIFQDTNVHGLSFIYSVFPYAILQNSSFELCDFTGANFTDATLSNVTFDKCSLHGAKFAGAKFEGIVSFAGCDLTGADFTGIDLKKIDLNGAWNISKARLMIATPEDEEIIKNLIADEGERLRKLKRNHFINMTILTLAAIPALISAGTIVSIPLLILFLYIGEALSQVGAAVHISAAVAAPAVVISPAVVLSIVIVLSIILVIGGILCLIYGLKANKTSFELSLTGQDAGAESIPSDATMQPRRAGNTTTLAPTDAAINATAPMQPPPAATASSSTQTIQSQSGSSQQPPPADSHAHPPAATSNNKTTT